MRWNLAQGPILACWRWRDDKVIQGLELWYTSWPLSTLLQPLSRLREVQDIVVCTWLSLRDSLLHVIIRDLTMITRNMTMLLTRKTGQINQIPNPVIHSMTFILTSNISHALNYIGQLSYENSHCSDEFEVAAVSQSVKTSVCAMSTHTSTPWWILWRYCELQRGIK